VDFSDALRVLKDGGRVRRAIWKPGGDRDYGLAHLEIVPVAALDGREVMPLLLCSDAASGLLRPFAGSGWDLLAGDWELVP
jgi:hypothetical protein